MRIAICDDEKACIEATVNCIEDYMQERKKEIEYDCYNRYPDLEPHIDDYDLFVMDYQTPEIDGLSFANKIREKYGDEKAIVFVTSYSDIVYDTFAVKTHRFLIKPIDKAKFFEAIDSYLKTNHSTKHIAVNTIDGGTDIIDIKDILYIEVQGKECYVLTEENQTVTRQTIAAFEEELVPLGFFRAHRSYLVNLRKVAHFDNKEIEFSNGETVAMSRRSYKEFSEAYLKLD